MTSMEGEYIDFNNVVNVVEGEKKGNVERWLVDIEQQMFDTVKKNAIDCLNDT